MNGEAVYSCSQLAVFADGAEVTTVEGLARGDDLSPVQQAFADFDAGQCNYCIPGQIMAATALLQANPTPTEAEMRRGMSGNLSRCANYNHIQAAVLEASRRLRGEASSARTSRSSASPRRASTPSSASPAAPSTLGTCSCRACSTPASSAAPTPTPALSASIRPARRPSPASAASSPTTRPRPAGPAVTAFHERMVFNNPVRYAGEPVAAVAAVDRHTAEDALDLIEVEYEPLPFVLDARDALADDAPLVHDDGNVAGGRPLVYERGDLATGFAAADRIVEATYKSAYHNNAQMEPRAAVALWEGRNLTVWTTTQGVSNARRDIAKDLNLPQSNVRAICLYAGGGFGNKNQAHDFDLMAAFLAKQTGRPVKIEYSRHDDFIGVHGRWSTDIDYRMGATADGTLTAVDMRAISNMGAYMKSTGTVASFERYACPNARSEITRVFTNRISSANLRSPAYPQGYFAMEQTLDQLAHELGVNPLDMRLKNVTRLYQDKTPYTSNALEQAIREGAAQFGWEERWRPPNADAGPVKRGVGMALGGYPRALGLGSAIVRVNTDGSVQVLVGVVDIGTGAKTAMGMIAAEALGVPWDAIDVVNGDTTTTPFSIGESSSRTTVMTGWAVKTAAEDAQQQLFKLAAPLLDAAPEDLTARAGAIYVADDPPRRIPLARVASRGRRGDHRQRHHQPRAKGPRSRVARRPLRRGRGRHPHRPRPRPALRGLPRQRPDHQPAHR